MDACSECVTVSVRYRPGNILKEPTVKVAVDGESFSLTKEGVKRLVLAPGAHDIRTRCRFRRTRMSLDIRDPTRITIEYCEKCGRIRTKVSTVESNEELDFERAGY